MKIAVGPPRPPFLSVILSLSPPAPPPPSQRKGWVGGHDAECPPAGAAPGAAERDRPGRAAARTQAAAGSGTLGGSAAASSESSSGSGGDSERGGSPPPFSGTGGAGPGWRDLAQFLSLLDSAGGLHNEGKYAEARPLAERATALAEKDCGGPTAKSGRSSWALYKALKLLVAILKELGCMEEAYDRGLQHVGAAEACYGTDSLPSAYAIDALGMACDGFGQYATGLQHHTKALEMIERLAPGDKDIGSVLMGLSSSLMNLTPPNAEESLRVSKKAVASFEAHYGKDHRKTILAMFNQVRLYAALRPSNRV